MPFQGWHLAVAPLPRAVPWAAICEPFGLADSRIPTAAGNSKTPSEKRGLAAEVEADELLEVSNVEAPVVKRGNRPAAAAEDLRAADRVEALR